MSDPNVLTDLIQGLERAQTAKELLETVWLELGPHHNDLSSDTVKRLNDYFNFDDSE